MKYIRLCGSFLTMAFISLFLFSNIIQIDGGAGYQYLILTGIFSALLLLSTYSLNIFLYLPKSLLALIIFWSYVFFKLVFDTGDFTQLKAYTISTSGGIVFAFLIGALVSFSISDLYFNIKQNPSIRNIASWLTILYFCLVLALSLQSLLSHMQMVRADIFLIENQEGSYQRPGNFLVIQFMILCSLVALSSNHYVHFRKPVVVVSLILLLIAVSSMAISQLIGSNSALICIAGFVLMTFTYLFVSSKPGLQEGKLGIGFKSLMLGWLGKRMILGITLASIFCIVLLISIIVKFKIDTNLFRISGFGTHSNSSIESRYEIFTNNFIEHLSYNPFFGNSQVDVLTTGQGTYIHSLLSILTHYGLLGFSLFVYFILQMYKEMTQKHAYVYSLYNDNQYSLFRIFLLGSVLIIAFLSAFYTWMPLWFAFGLSGVRLNTFPKYSRYRINNS